MRVHLRAIQEPLRSCRVPSVDMLTTSQFVPSRSLLAVTPLPPRYARTRSSALATLEPALQRRGLQTEADSQAELRAFLERLSSDASTVVPLSALECSYARSSGPGGQNVNKLSTKCTLRLTAATASLLGLPAAARSIGLAQVAAHLLTKDGDLVVSSQKHRTQEANRRDCYDRLIAYLRAAAEAVTEGPTDPETRRRVEKHIRNDNAARLRSKKAQSAKKSSRRIRGDD